VLAHCYVEVRLACTSVVDANAGSSKRTSRAVVLSDLHTKTGDVRQEQENPTGLNSNSVRASARTIAAAAQRASASHLPAALWNPGGAPLASPPDNGGNPGAAPV
jgi:hypothetical protein